MAEEPDKAVNDTKSLIINHLVYPYTYFLILHPVGDHLRFQENILSQFGHETALLFILYWVLNPITFTKVSITYFSLYLALFQMLWEYKKYIALFMR